MDEVRNAGIKAGVLTLVSFRPFPLDQVRDALKHAKRVVVIEKSLAVGLGGVVRWRAQGAFRHRAQGDIPLLPGWADGQSRRPRWWTSFVEPMVTNSKRFPSSISTGKW